MINSELFFTPTGQLDFAGLNRCCSDGIFLPASLVHQIDMLSQITDLPVLIQGETGSGKNMLVKKIADLRRKNEKKVTLISLNCASLNNDVAEATLFGNRKGAYTGAHENVQGAVADADGGILFLDEIHCLDLSTQRKLLRLLDDGVYTRVGEAIDRKSNFQLIMATNRNLLKSVQSGEFILDLYMRIQGIDIRVPSLRERPNDFAILLALYFASHQLRPERADFEALLALVSPLYWPGNIRQLYRALDVMRFKAISQSDRRFTHHFEVTQLMDRAIEACNNENEYDGRGKPLAKLVSDLVREVGNPINLPHLMEKIESTIISYTMSCNDSINDVMGHLSLSRGKLDFKRRKYKLMTAES